jgi:hypothetical protein
MPSKREVAQLQRISVRTLERLTAAGVGARGDGRPTLDGAGGSSLAWLEYVAAGGYTTR